MHASFILDCCDAGIKVHPREHSKEFGDREALAASIERLTKLDVEALYPGHGEPAPTGGGRHIAAAREALRYYG